MQMRIKRSKKMKKTFISRIVYVVLALVLALSMAGCGGKEPEEAAPTETGVTIETDGQSFGNGSTVFSLTVTDAEGNEQHAEIHTDKETVGEALEEIGLIAGEEDSVGLYVKTVNGITVDYDKDGCYWAFYVNDEYAQTGVNSTAIVEGDSYAFKVEKG